MKKNSQTHIAKKVGISDSFFSEILSGKKSPGWETAKKLFETTGILPAYWMESRQYPEKLRTLFEEFKAIKQ